MDAEGAAKKRKRADAADVAIPDEIEIDVSLPEPLSKKAQRKATKRRKSDARPLDGDTVARKHSDGEARTSEDSDDDDDDDDDAHSPDKQSPADSKRRSPFGIWIGNLSFTLTKAALRSFIVDNAGIAAEAVTRIHLPAARDAVSKKPRNKGFAYVDLATQPDQIAALGVNESLLEGRRVLVKDAASFEGRPAKDALASAAAGGGPGKVDGIHKALPNGKTPGKKVFVGNLAFDVAREDLERQFEKCGAIEDVHVATFEDSGKCKGFAWVTFEDVEAAAAAARGWTLLEQEDSEDEQDDDQDEEEAKRNGKPRKWFVNRLFGRDLRCEFAEDASTRYEKRFGKGRKKEQGRGWRDSEDVDGATMKRKNTSVAHAHAPRESTAIVQGTGSKIVFD
ncbi:hypothetical protein BDY21DRAFT_283518 [Lineolata rhizophorae]|uniref:RRM domain-containing protein n=1 Tax=Lineolata rhizophorae TaxID=578093 RepID=A0A6A6P3U5_9PEZI|nr:hypothetical protein BDY21DRAFT_283518 [Lineolata rhizophorae]